MKLSKTQLYKIGKLVGFLGKLLEPLIKTRLSLIGNALKSLARLPAAAASAADAAFHKKCLDWV